MACRNPAARELFRLSHSSLCARKGAPDAGELGLSLAADRESARLVRLSAPPYRGAQERCAIAQGCAKPPDATDDAARRGADYPQDFRRHPAAIAPTPLRRASVHRARRSGWEHEPACGACASSGFWLRYKARRQEPAGSESWPGGRASGREPLAWCPLRLQIGRLAAPAPAAVSGYGIKPDGKSLRGLNLGQVAERAGENLLHGVLCVFRMPADLHAEGIDRVLQQADSFIDGFRSVAV